MGRGWRAYGWSFNCCRVRCIPVVGDHVKISVAENRGLVHYSSWAQLRKSVSCISGLDCISCKSPYSRSLIVVLNRDEEKNYEIGDLPVLSQGWEFDLSIFEKDRPWSNRSRQSFKKIDRDRIVLFNLLKRSTVIDSILFTIESIFDKKNSDLLNFLPFYVQSKIAF